MEPISRPNMSRNTNTTVATAANVTTSAGVELLLSPTRSSVSAITSNTKTTDLCHNNNLRVLQHCSNSSNVIQHHQYPPILVAPPPLVPSPLIHSTQTSSLLPTSQLMLSTTTTTTPGSLPQFQQHGGSHQMVTASTVPVSAAIMPSSNITTAGMALSPFGILPHERVVPNHIHHRHQHKKLSSSPSSKTVMDASTTNSAQILNTPAINPQRFYVEPTHLSNKMKQYDSIQQQQNRAKIVNGLSDKNLPIVSSTYSPQSYEQRYIPRTTSHQVGYLSVITRTAATTSNGTVMNDIVTNSNYYQTQPIPLQTKTTDNHDRHYYHFDSAVSANQTPQQQIDNILLMGTPVQRGDPMHIVKNLQSMQSDIDCYGINNKSVGPTPLLNNSSKSIIEHHHLQQLPKSAVIDSSSSYNSQYFNRRQPPPAHLHQHNQPHLQQHIITGNPKILPTPTSLTVVSANGNTYLDVQQHQRHNRWNLEQHKPPTVSTSSCFPTSLFNQPSLQHQHQTYHNTVSTFNVQSSASSIHPNQQVSQPTHQNNFIVTSANPTYYSPTTTMVSSTVTSVTIASPPPSLPLYNRSQHNNNRPQQNPNNYHDLTNVHRGNYVIHDNNNSPSVPHVIVPNIEQELSHLCDDSISTADVKLKPLNVNTRKPSFIDSYIKFIQRGTNNTVTKEEDECFNEKKMTRPLSSSTPKPISKPYIPLAPLLKPKVVSTSEQTSRNIHCEDKKASNVSTTITTTTTTDDDPRYFPLPKTSSSIAGISDDSHGENSWLSADDEQDQWWISSSKGPCSTSSTATSMIKNKVNVENKKKKSVGTLKKKRTNSVTAIKKQSMHKQVLIFKFSNN